MKLVETVAKAISDPGQHCGFRGDRGMLEWQARAAIEAALEELRFPSPAILSAGNRTAAECADAGCKNAGSHVWQAMITEALAELRKES